VTAPNAGVASGGFLLGVGLAAYPLLSPGPLRSTLAIPAGLALLLYLMAVVGLWPGGLSAAVGLLAIEYLASLYLRGIPLDVTAPAYGACLFLCAELGWLAVEGSGDPRWLARWFVVAGVASAGAALGWGLLVVASVPLVGGLPLTALGVVAVVALAGALAWLARSARQDQ